MRARLDADVRHGAGVRARSLPAIARRDVQLAVETDVEAFAHAEPEDRRGRHVDMRDVATVEAQHAAPASLPERPVHQLEAVVALRERKTVGEYRFTGAALV